MGAGSAVVGTTADLEVRAEVRSDGGGDPEGSRGRAPAATPARPPRGASDHQRDTRGSDVGERQATLLIERWGDQVTLRHRKAVLRVVTGPDVGKELAFASDRLSIGTHESNTLVLGDETVSHFHTELTREREGVRLRDLGSTNGTWAGGLRVADALLGEEATFSVGNTTLHFSLSGSSEAVPLHPSPQFGRLFGQSAMMRAFFAQLERIASTDTTVLLRGESGTGKELAAEAIHAGSRRKDGPFIIVDCGSIPPELVESELFGHEKGAFTGAIRDRAGAFEAAHGGTIFLDEVGELPLSVQPKLLRALESRQVKRVGSETHRRVDVRIISATHRDLREAVNRGTFREDLYFRLAVVSLRLPSLRERKEDLPGLLERFWRDTLAGLGLPARIMPGLKPELLARLQAQTWDGNVRELRNFVERSVAMCRELSASFLEGCPTPPGTTPSLRLDLPFKEAKASWVDHFERAYLSERLSAAGGNVAQLAREADVDRPHVLGLLKKHGLR